MSSTATMPAIDPTPAILIGGKTVGSSSGETLDSVNPATGELIAKFPRCTPADVDKAVEAAAAAARAWAGLAPLERRAIVLAFADAIDARADELAYLDSIDNGSPLHEMRRDVDIATTMMRYYAGLALEVRGATVPQAASRLNYTLRQPYGVVGKILPFNHPLLFTVAKSAAPLIAGNTVVIKPSEATSLSTLAMVPEFQRIFPAGVVNIVTGLGSEIGDAIVEHPDVPRLAFIGSVETGMRIQRRAAEHQIKTVSLELGGKNPILVLPDADLDEAIAGTIKGMNFTWQGQSCGSTSRLLLHRDIHDEFIGRLAEKMEALRSGSPQAPTTDTGSMVNKQQYEKTLRYIDIGREDGAKLVAGGTAVTTGECADGFFVRPTLFTDVDPRSRLAQEEIFGPVLAAIKYDTFDEAIAIANDVPYGLTASVYTSDLSTAMTFARDIQAGYVWVNESSAHVLGTPFGGYKNSGIGREEDGSELDSYTQVKNVNVRFQ